MPAVATASTLVSLLKFRRLRMTGSRNFPTLDTMPRFPKLSGLVKVGYQLRSFAITVSRIKSGPQEMNPGKANGPGRNSETRMEAKLFRNRSDLASGAITRQEFC